MYMQCAIKVVMCCRRCNGSGVDMVGRKTVLHLLRTYRPSVTQAFRFALILAYYETMTWRAFQWERRNDEWKSGPHYACNRNCRSHEFALGRCQSTTVPFQFRIRAAGRDIKNFRLHGPSLWNLHPANGANLLHLRQTHSLQHESRASVEFQDFRRFRSLCTHGDQC